MIFVEKKDITKRLCVHYGRLKQDGIVDRKLGPTHESTRTCSEQRHTMQRHCTDRSDRSQGAVRPVTAGKISDKPVNASLGRPVGAGARRVVLGSAGHLERPQST